MSDSAVPADPDLAAAAVADELIERMRRGAAAGDHAEIADAARDGWYEMLTTRGPAVREVLEAMPAAAFKDQPVLLMMLGLVYNANLFQRARGLRYFATAVSAARRVGQRQLPALDRALIRTGESAALRLLGRPSMGVEPARLAVAALDELSTSERADARHIARLYTQSGITLFYAGRTAEAIDAFSKGVAETPASAPAEGFGSMAMLAGIHARDGHLGEARLIVRRVRDEPAVAREASGYTGTFYRVAEALLALEEFDVDTARQHMAKAAPNRRIVEHWVTVAETDALIAIVAGDPAAGLAELEAAAGLRGAEGRSAQARQQLARVRGLLHLALGDVDAASAVAQRDARSGAGAHIERARVALAMNQPGTALRELKVTAGSPLSPRRSAEAAALEVAVLTKYPPRPRHNAVVLRLAALLTRSGLRLPLALLPAEDLGRVLGELARVGLGDLTEEIPRSLLLETQPEIVLTRREIAVLAALPESGSVSQLAQALGVSHNTVKTQLRTLYRKLGVTSREDAVAVAIDRHLLPLGAEHDAGATAG